VRRHREIPKSYFHGIHLFKSKRLNQVILSAHWSRRKGKPYMNAIPGSRGDFAG